MKEKKKPYISPAKKQYLKDVELFMAFSRSKEYMKQLELFMEVELQQKKEKEKKE